MLLYRNESAFFYAEARVKHEFGDESYYFFMLELIRNICYYVFTRADVNFVPTFFIKGRIDSNGPEVYPPILSLVGNGAVRGVHPPARLAGNKIAFAIGFIKGN